MIQAINKNVLKGDNPFVVGSTVWAVRNGVESMKVRHIDKLGCDTRLWDLHMDEMFFAYECFPTEEEAKAAYEVALKEELAKLTKSIDSAKVASMLIVKTNIEVLEAVGEHCDHYESTEQGADSLIVEISLLENYPGGDVTVAEFIKIAKRAGCTYLYLQAE